MLPNDLILNILVQSTIEMDYNTVHNRISEFSWKNGATKKALQCSNVNSDLSNGILQLQEEFLTSQVKSCSASSNNTECLYSAVVAACFPM